MKAFLIVALALVSATADGAERAMRWSRLAVTAHLDGHGVLHIDERHTIRFDGHWNGGERSFRNALEEGRRFESIARIDSSGRLIPLREDDELNDVDEYTWSDSDTLRWRSRLPSDPPFDGEEITYVIRYALSHVVIPDNGTYNLDHNFGLPELEWPINAFTLDLTFDAPWHPLTPTPRITRANLTPGEDVVIMTLLDHSGAAPPAAVNHHLRFWIRAALPAFLLTICAWLVLRFIRGERAIGRFRPLIDPATIDRRWLEENLLKFRPEVVGAAWDERTDSAEVAAMIARLVQEGKMTSRVEDRGWLRGSNLILELKRDRESFDDDEKALVKSLFIAGDTTSTDTIKKHYEKKGFDPAAKIRDPLRKRLRVFGRERAAQRASWIPTLFLALSALALLAFGARATLPGQPINSLSLFIAIIASMIIAVLYIFGMIGAFDYQRRVARLGRWSLEFAIAGALIAGAGVLVPQFRVSPLTAAGAVLLALAAIRSIFNLARSRDAGERLENRRRLAAGREYFVHELQRPDPALEDAWFPYLLAFGLGPKVDQWFRAFGTSTTLAPSRSSFGGSSSTSGSASGWTGGGGAFGGAGATGSWAVAAGAMGSGVASASSRGGGGGGGRSGGGGGGGW